MWDPHPEDQLPRRQQLFLHALLCERSFSIPSAAKTAGVSAHRARAWFDQPAFRAALADAMGRRKERHRGVYEALALHLARMLGADPRDVFRDGRQLAPWELDDTVATIVDGCVQVTPQAWRYRFVPKAKVVDMFLRLLSQESGSPEAQEQRPTHSATVIYVKAGEDPAAAGL